MFLARSTLTQYRAWHHLQRHTMHRGGMRRLRRSQWKCWIYSEIFLARSTLTQYGAWHHLQQHTMTRGGMRRLRRSQVEVLDLRRDVLGEKHPDTIRSMASLAATYHAQGRYEEAEKIKWKCWIYGEMFLATSTLTQYRAWHHLQRHTIHRGGIRRLRRSQWKCWIYSEMFLAKAP